MKRLSVIFLILFCGLIMVYGQSKSSAKTTVSSNKGKTVTANGLSPKATALLSDLVLLNRPLTMQDANMMNKYGMDLVEGYLCVPVIATLKESITVDSLLSTNFPVEAHNGKYVLVNVPVMSYVDFARCGLFDYIQLKSEGNVGELKGLSPGVLDSKDSLYKQKAFDEKIEKLKEYYNPEEGFFKKVYTDAGSPHFTIMDNKGNFKFAIGGNVHFTMFLDFWGSVSGNDFTTTNIVVPTDNTPHFGLTAGSTKLNFKAEGKVGKRNMVGFIEMGVSAANGGITLRHAYVSYAGLTVGHTWSQFMDLAAGVPTVDLEGPNTQISIRHPLIAYTLPIGKHWHLAVSAELPSLSYVFSANQTLAKEEFQAIPDFVFHANYKSDIWHVQAGVIFRDLAFNYSNPATGKESTQKRFGWGTALSGSVLVAKKVMFSGQFVFGEGIASYIQDLANAKVDLVFMHNTAIADPTKSYDLTTPMMCGFYAAMQVFWTHRLNSSFIYGYTNLVPMKNVQYGYLRDMRLLTESNGDAFDSFLGSTHYVAANLFFHINDDLSIGGEYLFGMKKMRGYNGNPNQQGIANRVDFMLNYSF